MNRRATIVVLASALVLGSGCSAPEQAALPPTSADPTHWQASADTTDRFAITRWVGLPREDGSMQLNGLDARGEAVFGATITRGAAGAVATTLPRPALLSATPTSSVEAEARAAGVLMMAAAVRDHSMIAASAAPRRMSTATLRPLDESGTVTGGDDGSSVLTGGASLLGCAAALSDWLTDAGEASNTASADPLAGIDTDLSTCLASSCSEPGGCALPVGASCGDPDADRGVSQDALDARCSGGRAGSETVCSASSNVCKDHACHRDSDCQPGKLCGSTNTCGDTKDAAPPPAGQPPGSARGGGDYADYDSALGASLAATALARAGGRGHFPRGLCWPAVADDLDTQFGGKDYGSLPGDGGGTSNANASGPAFAQWAAANPRGLCRLFHLRAAPDASLASAPIGTLFVYAPGQCDFNPTWGHIELKVDQEYFCSDGCEQTLAGPPACPASSWAFYPVTRCD